jgi:peptidoglycan-N-acetylglucosamine deacetylase
MSNRPAHPTWRLTVAGAVLAAMTAPASPLLACTNPERGLPVVRTVEIDTANGPIFGAFTRQAKEPSFLRRKEVVLTFDDGPMPWITKSILDTLDDFCTKATFFSVGRMALAYPETVQDVMARGHTLGTHTMTHPFNMHRLAPERAHGEIERGFAAVALAADEPIAPFFRFPGLADSGPLLEYLQSRGIAAFTVDVVSNDSYIANPQKLASHTLAEIERAGGGIVLFHDIKASTAKALPVILKSLRERGYAVVHMRAKAPMTPLPQAMAAVSGSFNPRPTATSEDPERLPFYGRIGPVREGEREPSIDIIAPAPRARPASKPRESKPSRSSQQQQPRARKAERDGPKQPRAKPGQSSGTGGSLFNW